MMGCDATLLAISSFMIVSDADSQDDRSRTAPILAMPALPSRLFGSQRIVPDRSVDPEFFLDLRFIAQ